MKINKIIASFVLLYSINAPQSMEVPSSEPEIWPASHFSQDEINQQVAKAAHETYAMINNNPNITYPTEDAYGVFKIPGWKIVKKFSVDGLLPGFVKEDNLLMSEALDTFLTGPSAIECRLVMNFVMLKCLQQVFGINNFDALIKHYKNTSKTDMEFYNVADLLILGFRVTFSQRDYPGLFRYISNIIHYDFIRPRGSCSGQNVACVEIQEDIPLYNGFDSIFKTPQTRDQIEDYMYEDVLIPRTELEEKLFSEYDPKTKQHLDTELSIISNDKAAYKLSVGWANEKEGSEKYYIDGTYLQTFFKETEEGSGLYKMKKDHKLCKAILDGFRKREVHLRSISQNRV